jgi:hypothetical protein
MQYLLGYTAPVPRVRRILAVLTAAPACLLGLGCAGGAWADQESKRAVETAAADDSFPSAAEVGLAAKDSTPADDAR